MLMFYIVGTAIGNIEDTTFRAVRTLSESDIIIAEDTRTFATYYKKILYLYNLKSCDDQKIIPFHDQNEFKQTPYILKMLRKGLRVSMVSESGMPLISDPGSFILQRVMREGIPYTVVPGPSALTASLSMSGYIKRDTPVVFLGFLPKNAISIKKILSKHDDTVVLYESPKRIKKTLSIIHEISPERDICICREMTKIFEECTRGKARDLAKRDYKGELTVVLSPRM